MSLSGGHGQLRGILAAMQKRLIALSSVIFAIVGIGYLVAPGAMLGVVGIGSAATTEFLMRTEGVALLTGGGFLWAARNLTASGRRIVLASLAGYYIVGSLVDLAAFAQGIVGSASVPSAVIRIGFGVACIIAARTTSEPERERAADIR